MPTDLAFKFAARQAICAFPERERREGWWGDRKMADYCAQQADSDDPFNWIKAHALMTPEALEGYPFDHAGKGETSFLMALPGRGRPFQGLRRQVVRALCKGSEHELRRNGPGSSAGATPQGARPLARISHSPIAEGPSFTDALAQALSAKSHHGGSRPQTDR
jgi:hypothetical protein